MQGTVEWPNYFSSTKEIEKKHEWMIIDEKLTLVIAWIFELVELSGVKYNICTLSDNVSVFPVLS